MQKITWCKGSKLEIFCNIAFILFCCKKTRDEGQGLPALGTEEFVLSDISYIYFLYLFLIVISYSYFLYLSLIFISYIYFLYLYPHTFV